MPEMLATDKTPEIPDSSTQAVGENVVKAAGCLDSDDEDDEPIVLVRKRNRGLKPVLREDSDEEDDFVGARDQAGSGYKSEDDHRESDCSSQSPIPSGKRKSRLIAVPQSPDSKSGDQNDHDSEMKQEKNKKQLQNKGKRCARLSQASNLGSSSEPSVAADGSLEQMNDSEEKNSQRAKSFLTNDDLFDAEDSAGSGNSSGEESSSLNAIKKSAKAKVIKSEKPKKLNKDGMKQLHSESQRIVRESRVSLPYHVPKPKSLEDFLNRQKRTPSSLRPSSSEITSILQADMNLRKTARSTFNNSSTPKSNSCSQLEIATIVNTSGAETQNGSVPDVTPSSVIVVPPTDETRVCSSTDDSPRADEPQNELQLPAEVPAEKAASTASHVQSPNLETEQRKPPIGTPNTKLLECQTPVLNENKLLSRLQLARNLNVSHTPKLSGTPKSSISLDDENGGDGRSDDATNRRGEVDALIDRFLRHSSNRKKREAKQTVQLNVLRLNLTSSGEEQLSSEKLSVTLGRDEDEIPEGLAPGERMRLFKESLKSKLQLQRTEARKQRALLKAEDNEEMEDEDEPEEEVLSEPTESEEEDDSGEEEEEEVECHKLKDKQRENNIFIDDEAEESDADMDGRDSYCDDQDSDFAGDQCARPDSSASDVDSNPLPLRLRLSNESGKCLQDGHVAMGKAKPDLSRADTVELFPSFDSQLTGAQKLEFPVELEPSEDDSIIGAGDCSFELLGSIVPCYQPQRKRGTVTKEDDGDDDLSTHRSQAAESAEPDISFDEDPNDTSLLTQFRETNSQRKWSGEESCVVKASFPSSTQNDMDELLGLCSGTFSDEHSSVPRQVDLACSASTQNNMDELLGLCSGTFSGDDLRVSRLVDPACSAGTQNNMNELLGLCSGTFSGLSSVPATLAKRPSSQSTVNWEESTVKTSNKISLFNNRNNIQSDDEDSMSSTNSGPRVVRRSLTKKTKRVLSDTEEEEESANDRFSDECDSDGDEEFPKKKTSMRDFFDEEAELSGSEIPSDEDEELAEEDDILEEELGDLDVLSEDKLKEQVGKVHHKLLMDEDQKQLRLYKEVYLEDGDLHSETKGRSRNFRWRTIDDDSQNDYQRHNSDSEMEDEDGKEEEQMEMRLKRHERQKWLNESKSSQKEYSDEEEENLLVHKVQVISRNNSHVLIESSKEADNKFKSKPKLVSLRGSFLSRSKVELEKLADKTKGTPDVNKKVGPRNSRSCVFSVLSPTKEQRPDSPLTSNVPKSVVRAAKKPRLEKHLSLPSSSTIGDKSIFHLF